MKSRLPLVICCLLTTLLVGIWLGQSLPPQQEVHEEIVERSTVSPFNSDGWHLAMGQQTGPAAILSTNPPTQQQTIFDSAVQPAISELRESAANQSEPDIAYFPEVIVGAASETVAEPIDPSPRLPDSGSPRRETPLTKDNDAVWKSELSDLPPEHAAEILSLRQQLGSVASESLGISFPELSDADASRPGLFPALAEGEARPIPIAGAFPDDTLAIHASARNESEQTNKLRQAAERNYAENIANARTPGYKRRQFVLLNVPVSNPVQLDSDENVPGPDGVETVSADDSPNTKTATVQWLSRLDLRQGELTPTANPRDIAIAGQGWLQIKRDDQAEFVRTGMLGFDDERRLGIRTGAGLLPIIPELKLPVSEQRLIIAESGEVYSDSADGSEKPVARLTAFNFRNASALKRTSAGTYTATTESGPPLMSRPNSSRFLQSVLEASNVDGDSELAEMSHLIEIAR
jgi:flagellar basal body rod protein FlgG